MTYPGDFTLVTMNGTIAGGNEIWSAGFHIAGQLEPVAPDAWRSYIDDIKDTVTARLGAMYANAALLAPYDAPMTHVKYAHLDELGKYLEEAVDDEVTARGSNNTGYLPQGTLVSTLSSGKFKDPGKYNRFYLPIAPANLAGNWCLSVGQQEAYADEVWAAIQDINTALAAEAPGNDMKVTVASGSALGSFLPVTSVRIGAIVDTQRRRRNQLPEAYVTRPSLP